MSSLARRVLILIAVMIVTARPVRALAQVQAEAVDPAIQPALVAADHKADFHFQNAPIGTVLNYLATEYGFIVIPEVSISGRLTMLSRNAVTADVALVMLNTELRRDGYTAVRQSDRILKVMSIDKVKKDGIPVHFGIDPATITNTNDVITQVMVIQDDQAERIWQDVMFVCANDPQADFTASPTGGPSGLIITEKSSHIRLIADLIQDFIGPHGKTLMDLVERRQNELAGK